jgi:glycerate dehydrogenase
MSSSDIISIHAPYNARTAGLIGERELRLMKPTAFIINMGRGGIVDEVALAKVVGEGAIGGAALDVFSKEPLPSDNPLLHTARPERFRFTPHTAWASVEARARLVGMIADNIREWMACLVGNDDE